VESFFWELLNNWSHLGLFGVLIAAGMGLPLPEDIPLILAGLVVRKTDGSLLLMMLTGLSGVMVGDSVLFMLGRRYGPGIVDRRWFRRMAKPWLIEKARQKYENHGAKILFAGRFMPGLRAVLFLTAGVFKVPYWKFFVFDGSAALISVPVWVWAGWHFSGAIEKVFQGARYATIAILGTLAVALVVWIFWEYFHNLRKASRDRRIVYESPSGILEEATASLAASSAGDEPEPAAGADHKRASRVASDRERAAAGEVASPVD
jgi:membrane protein DedA with SNARE-associated domain